MSLRARMLAGLGIITGLLVAAGLLILNIQQGFLVGQLDERMGRQVVNATAEVIGGGDPGQPRRSRGMADLYLGLLTSNGLTTIDTPATDPGLTPVLDPADLPASPTTVDATGGEAARMRILTTTLPSGDTLLLGRSMADIDAALAGLRSTLLTVGVILLAVIGLVFWWMRRLGLDPILRVTRVAQSISSGDTSQRVEAFPAGTEAHDLGAAFNQLVETNASTQARLRQFVADASHELRTPLVTLKGYAALHGAGGLADDASTDDAMRRIRQEANRMGRLVEDLLLLTEMDQGRLQANEPVDVVEILTDLAGDQQVIDPERTVSLDVPDSAIVTGDRDRLTQVFAGLTTNALRHTPRGTPIDLHVSQPPGTVRVEVTDHGTGIAAQDLPKVFDRFYRADVARARASGGSGLGLAIASAIVHAHGGTVGVASPVGQGATFWVELPATERTSE
jgi:two-component system OmpR family sensor kinase